MRNIHPRNDDRFGGSSLGLLLGIGALGALGMGWWFTRDPGAESAQIDPDRIVAVERQEVIDSVQASGRVEPLARVFVMSRASGIIKELMVDEGDVVESQQVLAELDREQLDAQKAENEANKQAAQARVDAAKARIAEARVRVEDPELAFLQREADRLTQLQQQGDASEKELEDAKRLLAAAQFRVDQVKASLPVLQAALAESQAGLASANATLERTDTALREATIRSSIDGVVLTRDKEIGDGVSSILTAGGNATQVMTLGDLSSMHIEARVDEVDLGKIYVDMPALITVDAFRGRVLSGKVERIAPAGSIDDNGIVTFEVRVSVEDPERILKPDMTADARLVLDRRDGVLVLPQIAIQREKGGKWSVEKLVGTGDDAQVERTVVRLGLSDGLLTEIESGLAEGDRVLLPERGAGRRR